MSRTASLLVAVVSLGLVGCGEGQSDIASNQAAISARLGDGWFQIQEGVFRRPEANGTSIYATGVSGARWLREQLSRKTAMNPGGSQVEQLRIVDAFLDSVAKQGTTEASVGPAIVPDVQGYCDPVGRSHLVVAQAKWSSPYDLTASATAFGSLAAPPAVRFGNGLSGFIQADDSKPVPAGGAVDGQGTVTVGGSGRLDNGSYDSVFAYKSTTFRCTAPARIDPPDPCARSTDASLRPPGCVLNP